MRVARMKNVSRVSASARSSAWFFAPVTLAVLLCSTAALGEKKKLIAPFEVHVAVDGSDTHPGTAERPVAMPEKARRRERFAW